MLKKIIEFYSIANNLKHTIRTGWSEVGIPTDKIESVADHVYGCYILAICLASEFKLELDMTKVLKMLTIKELTKAKSVEENSIINRNNNAQRPRDCILEITKGLEAQSDLLALYDEYSQAQSAEAKFTLYVSKFESDLQAKLYDLNGDFTLENAIADVQNYPSDLRDEILPNMESASDGWLQYDRKYYTDNKMFTDLSIELQNYQKRN